MSYRAKMKPTMRSIVNARVVFIVALSTTEGTSSPLARFQPLSFRAELNPANNNHLLAGTRETQGVFGVPTDFVKLDPLTTKMFESGRLFFPSRTPLERTWIVRAPRTIITMGCEATFPGNSCNSASLTIGSNRFCGGSKQIGPITAQDSLYIVYRTRVTKSHFKCTVSSSYPVSGSDWSYYGVKGPSRWSQTFPTCGGKNQSPVDIDTSRALGEFPWKLLGLHGFNETPPSMGLTNNGKFVILKTRHQPYAMGGNLPLNQKYLLEGIVFHWGPTDYAGSEHAVNGRSYAAEIQLVHYNSKYGRYQLALNKTDGVAIFSIFLDISARDNLFLDPVILGLRNIRSSGISTDIIPFPIKNLLPQNYNEFYRYVGSTSFPPCEEGIIWTIFKNTISISSRQLDEFRFLEDPDGLMITKNVRPIQALNGRTVSGGQLTPSWSHSGPDGE
ncbi:carbonic anhydrase 2-like [Macrobrachium rosenbergii]|uniref:carbonic anhydrase 2-like n=1 Tax=Macrobrachium rosenbergii TaxID=79674 RepID=UPI0034D69DC9